MYGTGVGIPSPPLAQSMAHDVFARTTFPDQQALIRTLVNQVQVQGPGFGMFVLNMPDLFENEDGVRGFDVNRPGLLQRSVG